MTPEQLNEAIVSALRALANSGVFAKEQVPSEVVVERPKNRDHGDWATNVAMQLAGKLGINPRELAEKLAKELRETDGVESVSIAGPGFINFFVSDAAAGALAKVIVEQGDSYGLSSELAGQKLNLEFVSANPTGPIHLGGTRWAAVGDSLARILQSQGASVTREYYFNDHGAQIDRFARSLVAAALGQEAPEDGYAGEYITEISQQILTNQPEVLELTGEEQQEAFRAAGVGMMFEQIKKSLEDFGVHFDVFFHENSLYESGAVEKSIARLRELGHLFEEEGALWLRSSTFGDDRDRVVIKSDGDAAYIAGDIAYYLDKRDRGFDTAIYMLGADHHGYVPRMMALCAAFGDEPGKHMEILIGQLVSLVRDGQPVRMSKRAGNVVTMEDLVEAVGVDAARYALSRSSINSTLDIDIELLARRTNDNPVFYVQYAHARVCSLLRQAGEKGYAYDQANGLANLARLDDDTSLQLMVELSRYPEVVEAAGDALEPHLVAQYLRELAYAFHTWYAGTPVLIDDAAARDARLALALAVRQALANGLDLLGVSAPEKM